MGYIEPRTTTILHGSVPDDSIHPGDQYVLLPPPAPPPPPPNSHAHRSSLI